MNSSAQAELQSEAPQPEVRRVENDLFQQMTKVQQPMAPEPEELLANQE